MILLYLYKPMILLFRISLQKFIKDDHFLTEKDNSITQH